MDKDSSGRLFLDFNPYCFSRIVDCLRSLRIATPGKPVVLSNVEPDLEDYFEALMDYLGLGSLLYRWGEDGWLTRDLIAARSLNMCLSFACIDLSEHDPRSYIGKKVEVLWSKYNAYYAGTLWSCIP